MLTGVSFMSMVATVMVHHARGVTGYDFNIFAEITVSKNIKKISIYAG